MLKRFGRGSKQKFWPWLALRLGLALLALLIWFWGGRGQPAEQAMLEVPEAPEVEVQDEDFGEALLLLPPEGPQVSVLFADGVVRQVGLESFLVGVLAAEMPASFAPEALKAQAIAARTYILRHTAEFGRPRHANADVCANPDHCQAYLSVDDLRVRWGANFDQHYQAIAQAVAETRGLVLFYDGQLAEALYSSTCGGHTQSAADLWGRDVPYLQAVNCAWDSHAPRFIATLVLGLQEAGVALNVNPYALRSMYATYTMGGAIDRLSVDGRQFSGLELRQALGLNSATVSWLIDGEEILFSTLGFGHGVGLCQYGADCMAQNGYTAADILRHYYQGISIKRLF